MTTYYDLLLAGSLSFLDISPRRATFADDLPPAKWTKDHFCCEQAFCTGVLRGAKKGAKRSWPCYAEYLAALLDLLGITRAHIVAHDFEGLRALAWAAGHPGALASATLVNTGMVIDYR